MKLDKEKIFCYNHYKKIKGVRDNMEIIVLIALMAFLFWTVEVLKNTYHSIFYISAGRTPRKEKIWLWHKR